MMYKIIYRNFVFFILCLFLAGCDRYHGFGCIAPESHPAVAHARTLTAEQLKFAYYELYRLSDKYAQQSFETPIEKNNIPGSLQFLEAEFVLLHRFGPPSVMLANCLDERIELEFSAADKKVASIKLYWAAPTDENPYAIGGQTLWENTKE